jgi:hypothetical protein
MWTAIAYREVIENNTVVRLYDDPTEKAFDVYEDAVAYAAYLAEKLGVGVDVYEKTTIPAGGLDIDELKRQDALDKLTPEEKALLGL